MVPPQALTIQAPKPIQEATVAPSEPIPFTVQPAKAAVQEIESFTIFDRWGNMMYLNEHFLPNDPGEAWDGTRNGVTFNPAVYAYKLIARFTGGSTQVRYGDVTLMR